MKVIEECITASLEARKKAGTKTGIRLETAGGLPDQ